MTKLYDKNGTVGIGESANLALPIYEPEYNRGMITLLQIYLLPLVLNKEISSVEALEDLYGTIRGNNFAKAAVESAFWHIESQIQGKPLRELWGGTKTTIPVAISIGLGTTLKNSIEKVKRSIETNKPKRAKIKITPGIDIGLIEAIRNAYPKLPLMVDANAGYTPKDVQIFKKLDEYGLIMIEQPLRFDDLVEHAKLQETLKTPICLDESINGFHAAEQAIELGACKIINIKPQRVGGYHQAKLISEFAQKHTIPVWCGGMIESGWGQLFNCHIATLPNFTYENDICLTKWYFADDILEKPIEEKDGFVDVSSTDQLFNINDKKLKKYTVRKMTVR